MDEPRGAYPTNPKSSIPARRTRPEDRGGEHFSAPLGLSETGRLRFANGAHRVIVRADTRLTGLYRARFGDRMPTIRVQGGVVTIRSPRLQAREWASCGSGPPAEMALNAGIPWDIEVRGGSTRLLADLRDLRLGSFCLDGGAGRAELTLPAPCGTVTVVFLGGASNVDVSRPMGVTARLRVEGGATNLTFDGRRIGAAGGDLDLRGRGYESAADRYDIAVKGGANNLSVDQRGAVLYGKAW